MPNPIITFEKVSFYYDKTPVLLNIDVQIEKGEYVGIFGPNGGGKTTFFQLLLGFITPFSGKITIFGQSPKKIRKRIGYVPQSLIFDRKFPISCLDVVLLGALSKLNWWGRFSEKEKKKAYELLEKMGILDLKDEPFGNLSGGQAQRTLIARSLMNEPEILLLDEPTANIDPTAGRMIKEFLLHLKGQVTVLHITHELADVSLEIHRMLCFQNHLTIYSPQEVCEHFAHGLYHPPLNKEDLHRGN